MPCVRSVDYRGEIPASFGNRSVSSADAENDKLGCFLDIVVAFIPDAEITFLLSNESQDASGLDLETYLESLAADAVWIDRLLVDDSH